MRVLRTQNGDRPAAVDVAPSGEPANVELRLGGMLTRSVAPALARSVREVLALGARSLILNLEAVRFADVVGLATILESQRRTEREAVACTARVSSALHRWLIDAKLMDELALAPLTPPARCQYGEEEWGEPAPPVTTPSSRVALRQPSRHELAIFGRWARDPLIDQMVGSDLLYRCRYLDPDDPEVVRAILGDPRAVIFLVVTRLAGEVVGFVRLYDAHLAEGFAFLETVITEPRSLRKGLGIDASRLLLAYGMDVLGLRRVEAKVYAYNVLSINALRRNGFQQEGVLRKARLYDNELWDILVFSILEPEMRTRRAEQGFPYFGFWEERP